MSKITRTNFSREQSISTPLENRKIKAGFRKMSSAAVLHIFRKIWKINIHVEKYDCLCVWVCHCRRINSNKTERERNSRVHKRNDDEQTNIHNEIEARELKIASEITIYD